MYTERKHRLPLENYRGLVAVSYTACIQLKPGVCIDDEVSELIVSRLFEAAKKHECEVVAWCLMPNHLHIVLQGSSPTADSWRALVAFKQQTGYWLTRNRRGIEWQKDFYDHIIRSDESLEVQVNYLVCNPVRAGLVDYWWHYRRTGGVMVEKMLGAIQEGENPSAISDDGCSR